MSILVQSLTFTLLASAAPPDECTESAMQALFEREKYDAIIAISRTCLRSTRDPYFHYAAGQAHHFLGRYPKAIKELESFLKNGKRDDPNRAFAGSLLKAATQAVALPKGPKPRLETRTGDGAPRRPRSPVASDEKQLPRPVVPPPGASPDLGATDPGSAADVRQPDPVVGPAPTSRSPPEIEGDLKPGSTARPAPPEPEVPAPSGAVAKSKVPDFRRGWIGLGVAAAGGTLASIATLTPGLLLSGDAFQKNEQALRAAGLNADFPYGECAAVNATGCPAAVELETSGYSARQLHQDLGLASRLQATAVIAEGVALGGLLGAAPIRGTTTRVRRVGLVVALGSGVAIGIVGAVVYGTSRSNLGGLLQGTDIEGRGETWRTTRDEFWRAQGPSLAGATLLGIGAGALLGAGLGVFAEYRIKSGERVRARLRLIPRIAGVALAGRF